MYLMRRPAAMRRGRRRVVAVVLVVVAVAAIVAEPFPKGVVVLSFTHEHGIDAGDLPAFLLLLAAARLAL
jgi:hypothetical protein